MKSKRDLHLVNQQKADRKIRQLFAKRRQVIIEYYRKEMPKVIQDYQVVVIERLNTKDMRKPGKGKGKDRGFNRRLSLIKPFELQQVLANYAWKHGVPVVKVDSYKTSQVEFGTTEVHKHALDKREWISPVTGKKVLRDLNAAKNILDWGIHPDHHYKVKQFAKVQPPMVADFM